MFEALSDKLSGVFDRLRGRGALSEADVTEALREVRLALLDADVALPVVRDFIAKVRERAVGAEVLSSVTPGQQVVKIVNDVLVEALGGEGAVPLNLNAPAPIPILMVGLQGSGKTTTSGKLALRLRERLRRRVLLASLDTQRPAAQLQLAQLAEQAEVPSLPIVAGADAGADRPARHGGGAARRLRHRHPGHRRPAVDRRGADGGGAAGPRGYLACRDAAGGRCDDRAGRGEHRQGVQRGGRA